ncbi:hypothetical protein DFH06DRAFT_1476947 [Mycena polygramma]|nr:hypothetical protein DFH06DRAFT_1476947 [Mycena polygramma]
MAPGPSRIKGAQAAVAEKRAADKKRYQKFPGRIYVVNGKTIELETLYLVDTPHPLRSNVPGGKTYIYYADTSKAGCQKTWDQEKDLEVPMGTTEVILALGHLQLYDKDAVFSRSLHGGQDPMKDIVQIWVTGGRLYTAPQKLAIESARDTMLGPKESRARARATDVLDEKNKATGEMIGGTAYERTPYSVSVKAPARAYTIGPSLEAPTSIMAPVASTKIDAPGCEEMLDARSAMLRLATAGAMRAAEEGPEALQGLLQQHSDFVNKPRTGSPDNWAYGTTQINIAAAKMETADPENATLSADLATFGVGHIDGGDAPAYTTHMGCYHDVPKKYKPGRFHILQLGVFVLLEQYCGINFYGLRKHGGTASMCPLGGTLRSWAYRFVAISYPPKRMVNGTARFSLAALPNEQALLIPPEMINAGCSAQEAKGWSPAATTGRSTFIREGVRMMDAQVLVAFVVHNLIALCFYVLRQLPAEWGVRLEPDMISKAITFVDADGRRKNTGQWLHAPGHRRAHDVAWDLYTGGGDTVDQDIMRSAATEKWDKYQNEVAMHIPYTGQKGGVFYRLPEPIDTKKKKKKKVPKPREERDSTSASGDNLSDAEPSSEETPEKPLPKKPKKPKKIIPPPDHTDTGSAGSESDSEEEPPAPEPPIGANTRAGRAAARAERMAHDELSTAPLSENQKGKRKAVSDEDEPEAAVRPTKKHELVNPPSDRLVARRSSRFESDSMRFNMVVVDESPAIAEEDVEMEDITSRRQLRSSRADSFVTLLHFDSIDANLTSLEYSCLTIANSRLDRADLWDVQNKLQLVEMAVFRAPNSEETPGFIMRLWPSVAALEQDEALTAVQQRRNRAVIMTTNYYAWRWLDGYCAHMIERALSDSAQDCWIAKLAQDVCSALTLRTQSMTFFPGTYNIDDASPEPFTYSCARPMYLTAGPELTEQVLTLTTTIIATWLRFPLEGLARQQAWFVHAIVTTIGHDALLLDEVWLAHSNVRKYILGKARHKAAMLACYTNLKEELGEHLLADVKSEERRMLTSISQLVKQACTGTLKYTPLGDSFEFAAVATPPAEDVELPPDIPARVEPDGLWTGDDDESGLRRGEPEEEGEPEEDLLEVASEKLFTRYIAFLTEAEQVLDDLPKPNTFQSKLLQKMDYIFPFREHAPSRVRAAGPNGPFTPERCRTDEGLYSGLVYRGVTFGTEFGREDPMVYQDADAFHKAEEAAIKKYFQAHGHAPDEKYFCDSAAFGPHNKRRKLHLVDTYSDSVASWGWSKQFEKRDKIPFLECWDNFRNPARFPIIGPLAGYLLTADFVYSGAVVAPTVDEMAHVIWFMNKGAASGLEHLRLIPKRAVSAAKYVSRADKEKVRKAVHRLYKRLQTVLSEATRTRIGFDLIVLEHSLCKFGRCIAKRWFLLEKGVPRKAKTSTKATTKIKAKKKGKKSVVKRR